MTYECRVNGTSGGATVWQGTAFDCPTNEITLLHNRFTSIGDFGVCNDGTIVAMSLNVSNNQYTSQLNVTISVGIIGKSIICINDNISHSIVIGSTTILATRGKLHILFATILRLLLL